MTHTSLGSRVSGRGLFVVMHQDATELVHVGQISVQRNIP